MDFPKNLRFPIPITVPEKRNWKSENASKLPMLYITAICNPLCFTQGVRVTLVLQQLLLNTRGVYSPIYRTVAHYSSSLRE